MEIIHCFSVIREHVVAQLVEELRYSRKVAGSIPLGVTGMPAAIWPWSRLSM